MLSKWQLPPSSPVHTDLIEHGLGGLEGKRCILEPEGLWNSSLVLGGIHLKKKKVIIFHTLLFLPMVGTTVALLGERRR